MENKTGKYIKYAIGEITLVMIGILLALQVNNWNEQRKENKVKAELISSLIEDFEGTQEILLQSISEADSLLYKMNTFYDLTDSDTENVSVDSLRNLSRSFFRAVPFEPILSTYEEAQSSGNLKLLKNKEFTNNMTSLKRLLIRYEKLTQNTYFNGSSWDLRKSIGSISLLVESPLLPKKNRMKPRISYSEYISIIESPIGEAVLENQYVLIRNMKGAFSYMNNILKTIITVLKASQKSET